MLLRLPIQSFRPLSIVLALLGLGSFAAPASAQYSWDQAVSGFYDVATNWRPSQVPGAGNNATLALAGGYTVTLRDDRFINNFTILVNPNAVLNHTGGVYTVSDTINLGTGRYDLNGGTISGGMIRGGGGRLALANNAANRLHNVSSIEVGTLNFSAAGARVLFSGTTTTDAGTTLNLTNGNTLGIERTATISSLTVNLGSSSQHSYLSVEGNNTLTLANTVTINATGFGVIGSGYYTAGSSQLVNQGLIEKTINNTQLSIAPSGGFVNQGIVRITADGGTVSITSGGTINTATGSLQVLANALLEINGTNWVNAGALVVNGGTANLFGTDWANNGTTSLTNGTLNLFGSTTTAGLGLSGLTRTGTTTVNLLGQVDNSSATLAITASTGTLRLAGGTISGGNLTAAGGANLLVSSSNTNRLHGVTVGSGALSFAETGGVLRVSGGTTFASGETFQLTQSNTLAFEQDATLSTHTVNLGNANQYSYLSVEENHTLTLAGTVNITGYGQIVSNQYVSGTGTIVNQGLIEKTIANTNASINPSVFTNNGTVRLVADSGTLSIPNTTNLTNFAANTLTGGTWEVHNNSVLDFDGRTISTIAGGATVVLNGSNSTFNALNALTTINTATLSVRGGRNFTPTGGTLAVNGTSASNIGLLEVRASSQVTANVNVNSYGRLTGSGTIQGNVVVNADGKLAPSLNGPLTVTSGNVSFNGGSSSTFRVELNAHYVAGTDYSQLVVDTPGSLIDLNGATLEVQLGFTPLNHEKMFIIDNLTGNHVLGTFAGLPQGAQIPGTPLYISYEGNSATDSLTGGNDVVLYNPVPEPGHILALAAAGAGIVGWNRRRHQVVAN